MHQVLFHIPGFHIGRFSLAGFDVYTYGVMLSLAFLVALFFALKRAREAGLPPETITDLCILLLLAGVIGARLLFVLEEWRDYTGRPGGIFNIREGGLSIHGGLLAGFLAGWWFVRRKKLDFWKTADALAPAIAIGMGVGRIGCFFNGCCLGKSTTLPWGVVFKDNPTFFGPRHPTQLYDMALDFLIAGILLFGFKNARPGSVFLWWVILTSASRFFLEFLRADTIPLGPLTLVQVLCLLLIAVGAYFLTRSAVPMKNEAVKAR